MMQTLAKTPIKYEDFVISNGRSFEDDLSQLPATYFPRYNHILSLSRFKQTFSQQANFQNASLFKETSNMVEPP